MESRAVYVPFGGTRAVALLLTPSFTVTRAQVECGSVLDDLSFSQDVTFSKDAAGESTVVGQFVNESGVARGIGRIHGGRVYAYQAESHERAQQRGRQHIAHLVDQLKVKPREESIESAHRVYKMALQKGFTRGRRTSHVAAACLYLLCRQVWCACDSCLEVVSSKGLDARYLTHLLPASHIHRFQTLLDRMKNRFS